MMQVLNVLFFFQSVLFLYSNLRTEIFVVGLSINLGPGMSHFSIDLKYLLDINLDQFYWSIFNGCLVS